jgi:2-polyprenyl-3-methyl-5-hydroxy-6-metoxy-1,4-benzoquinol methylase
MANLKTRCRRPELMDQPGLDYSRHAEALRGLARINKVSRSDAILWSPLKRLARDRGHRDAPLRLLDLACGGGDLAIALARRAARERLAIQIEGCDLSAQAIEFARHQAETRGQAEKVRFFVLDALRDPLPTDHDVICCSLFLHHLDESGAVALLRRMAAASRRLVLVNDLIRSRLGSLLAWVGCHVFTRSPIVHWDGPASVAAAFSPSEVLFLADQAGLRQKPGTLTLTRHWPQRFLLTWSRE